MDRESLGWHDGQTVDEIISVDAIVDDGIGGYRLIHFDIVFSGVYDRLNVDERGSFARAARTECVFLTPDFGDVHVHKYKLLVLVPFSLFWDSSVFHILLM